MTITPCKATGVTPFIVLRSATTNLAPTYVDAETHLTNLTGKYDVEISPAPVLRVGRRLRAGIGPPRPRSRACLPG